MKNSVEKIAAIYVRVSTTQESQKDSPEHQKGVCLEKAREVKLDAKYFYEDRDTGTSIIARPEIQKLIKDAKDGMFKTVIFASLSRFSRDGYDSLGLKRVLVDTLGIRLISIDENYDSSIDKDEFKFQIISAVNQKLSEQISLSAKRGLRQSALSGNFTGNIAPYGYKKATIENRKTLVPDEGTCDVVKKIYDMYVKQKIGEKNIAIYLNDEKIPSPKDGLWGITSLQRILTNPVYTGRNVFSKYESIKHYDDINNMSNRRRKVVPKDKSEWEYTPFRTHEPIISDELFEEAQKMRSIRGHGKRGGVRNKANIFAGLIFCSKCGSSMVSMRAKNEKYRYLACSKRRRQGDLGCDNKIWIPYFEFRDSFMKTIKEKLKSYINEEKFSTSIDKLMKNTTNNSDNEKEIKKLQKAIEVNRKLLFELRKMKMLDEIDEKQYEFEKEQYENDIKLNEEKLNRIQNTKKEEINKEKLMELAKQRLEEIDKLDLDDVDSSNIFLAKVVQRIEVSEDGKTKIFDRLQ